MAAEQLRRVGRALRRPPVALARHIRRRHRRTAPENRARTPHRAPRRQLRGRHAHHRRPAPRRSSFSVRTGEARGRAALYPLVTRAPFALPPPPAPPRPGAALPPRRRSRHGGRGRHQARPRAARAGARRRRREGRTGAVRRGSRCTRLLPGVRRGALRGRAAAAAATGRAGAGELTSDPRRLLATAPLAAGLHLLGDAWPPYAVHAPRPSLLACSCLSGSRRTSTPHVANAPRSSPPAPSRAPHPTGGRRPLTRQARTRREPRDQDEKPPRTPGRRRRLRRRPRTRRNVGRALVHTLAANAALRGLPGFLTLFLAFPLREHPLNGPHPAFLLELVVGAAGSGARWARRSARG